MPIVTKLQSRGRTGRIDVLFDDGRSVRVDLDLQQRYGLRAGEACDASTFASLESDAALLAAKDRALRMLAARGRSAGDLERRLVQKGVVTKDAREVVEGLKGQGWVDDERHARSFARGRALSGHGKARITMELRRQGVESRVVEAALGETWQDETVDRDAVLERLVARKLQGWARLDADARRRRLFGFLARRGHDAATIRRYMDYTPEER